MKNKLPKPVKVILIYVIGVLLCFALYYFIDEILNGSFVNWFEENYMIMEYKYIEEAGNNGLVREPNYAKIKVFLLWAFVVGVIIWISVVLLVAHLHSKTKVRQSVTQTSHMIHDFMSTDIDNTTSIFPKEYAEISTQMVEIKATMQRHEQILKEEATRKNDLIAYLAHDLKTPLTSVIGYLSLLDEAPDMPMQQRAKYVHITLDKTHRLESLINEFFEITRYNLQQIEIEKEPIDLYYMLVQMTDEFYPLLQKHGNSTELNVDENTTIYGDAVKLARVFNNILKYEENASMAGFQPGEEATLKDLLYGILLPSGAECCMAFADRIAGSEEAFVDMMNEKATEIGMSNTHFCNATGLHNPDHYSTVKDISILLKYALQYEDFRQAFSSSRYSTRPTNQHPDGFTFRSTMFKYMDSTEVVGGEIIGGKTGYTEEAGLCLASLAEVDGKEYILVTAKANGTHQTEQFHILDAINVYSQIGELNITN